MNIYKTTDRVRIEVLTDQETSRKLLRAVIEDESQDEAKRIKAADQLGILDKKDDPDKRLTFILAPLSAKQKSEVMGKISTDAGRMVQSTYDMGIAAIKASLKGVEGLTEASGAPYTLPIDKDGFVTDEGVDVLLNLPVAHILQAAARRFAGRDGVPASIIGDDTGLPMPNVEVIPSPKG